jgi:hypothetical protein
LPPAHSPSLHQAAALCVFANKKDLPGAKTAAEITELLGLTSMKASRSCTCSCPRLALQSAIPGSRHRYTQAH